MLLCPVAWSWRSSWWRSRVRRCSVMTLILSVLTKDYVVQASDRRLTNASTGEVVDDDANKAVVFNGHLAVGYTGLSRIRGCATDLWITEVLQDCRDPKTALTALCRDAKRDLAAVPARWRRQAFVLVGWTRVNDLVDLQPCAFVVSNFFVPTPEARWLPSPMDDFTVATRLPSLGGETPMVIAVPRAPRPPMVRVGRAVKEAVARGVGPTALGRLLEEGIRQVAATVQGVGRDVMVCSIPRIRCRGTGPLMERDASRRAAFANPDWLLLLNCQRRCRDWRSQLRYRRDNHGSAQGHHRHRHPGGHSRIHSSTSEGVRGPPSRRPRS